MGWSNPDERGVRCGRSGCPVASITPAHWVIRAKGRHVGAGAHRRGAGSIFLDDRGLAIALLL
jgi:hypothetical protein